MTFNDPHLFSMAPASTLTNPRLKGCVQSAVHAVDRFVSSAVVLASCVIALMAWL